MKITKPDLKNLTKKQKTTIIVAAALFVVVVTLSIVLPLTLKKQDPSKKIPEISFGQFDRLSDVAVTVSWNKISGTEKYYVEYCYGVIDEEKTKKMTTERTSIKIQRQRGVLSVRVKADENGFCDWKSYDIPALKLKAPSGLTISPDTLSASWNPVTFDYNGAKTEIFNYCYDLGFGDTYLALNFETGDAESFLLGEYIKLYISGRYSADSGIEWVDYVFNVRVKASVARRKNILAEETEAEKYLRNAYEDSEYAETTIIITKEIYEGLLRL